MSDLETMRRFVLLVKIQLAAKKLQENMGIMAEAARLAQDSIGRFSGVTRGDRTEDGA